MASTAAVTPARFAQKGQQHQVAVQFIPAIQALARHKLFFETDTLSDVP